MGKIWHNASRARGAMTATIQGSCLGIHQGSLPMGTCTGANCTRGVTTIRTPRCIQSASNQDVNNLSMTCQCVVRIFAHVSCLDAPTPKAKLAIILICGRHDAPKSSDLSLCVIFVCHCPCRSHICTGLALYLEGFFASVTLNDSFMSHLSTKHPLFILNLLIDSV